MPFSLGRQYPLTYALVMSTARPYNDPIYKQNRKIILQGNPDCALCGGPNANSADHITPLMHGGDHSLENLQPAHLKCNSARGARDQAKESARKVQARNTFLSTKQMTPTAIFNHSFLDEPARTGDDQPELAVTDSRLPRLETVGISDLSYGPLVAAWAELHMSLSLFEWQKHALNGQLAHFENGDLQFRESLVSTARQNGKTVGLQALIGWWVTDFARLRGKPQSVLSTANKLDRAESIFDTIAPILVEKFGGKAMKALGRKSVKLPDGSMWEVRAATASLHGGSHDLIVCDELWNLSPEVVDSALRPSMIARKNPLLSSWSTAGDESSICMIQYRETAIAEIDRGETSRLYFAEWSMPTGADPRDERNWVLANPSLGETITVEALQAVSKKDSFLRAHLNMWVSSRGAWLESGQWDKCRTYDPMPAGGVLAVDSSVDDARYVGVRSVAVNGRCHVAVEFVVGTEDEMWTEIERVLADQTVQISITPSLELHAPTVYKRRLLTFGTGEMYRYSAIVQKMILEGKVKHQGENTLTEHVNRAVLVKTSNGAILSSQKSPGPIELCRCMVVAIAESSRPQNRAKPIMVVG